MSIKRHGVGPRLSQAVVHGNTVYLAGQVAMMTLHLMALGRGTT